jgi:hypothetical protein
MHVWTWVLTICGAAATLAAPLLVPGFREAIGRYIAGFVQHHFNERIEKLRSELRQSETKFAAELRSNEQQLKSLSDAALSLRSSRQTALEARRLRAVEKLWETKIANDRMKFAAQMVATLNLDALYDAAERGDPGIQRFAGTLDQVAVQGQPQASALSEQPFLSPKVWALYSAYQGVLVTSVLHLKVLSAGTTQFMKRDDALKPLMLAALPEYKDYIEKFGFAGYYQLLDVLEQRLLLAIAELLDGSEFDQAYLRRNAEMMAAVQKLNEQRMPDIPEGLRAPQVPEPPKA